MSMWTSSSNVWFLTTETLNSSTEYCFFKQWASYPKSIREGGCGSFSWLYRWGGSFGSSSPWSSFQHCLSSSFKYLFKEQRQAESVDPVYEETIQIWESNGSRDIRSTLAMDERAGSEVSSTHCLSRPPSWPAWLTTFCHSSFRSNLMLSSGLLEECTNVHVGKVFTHIKIKKKIKKKRK